MSKARHLIRKFFASALGANGAIQLWWTPELPVVYINNAKCGCSTIKNSLRRAQAARYRAAGRGHFDQTNDPHIGDDCLKQSGMEALARSDPRLVISCARNPFTRSLSGYLDRVVNGDPSRYSELRGEVPQNFEAFLESLLSAKPDRLDPHFRPQYLNLWLTGVSYDAIFYLEDISTLPLALSRAIGEFELETYAPHSRRAQEEMRAYYTPRAVELVKAIYEEDFARLGYSRNIEDATEAPGAYWTPRGIVHSGREIHLKPASGLESLRSLIRYWRLVEARVI